MAHLRRPHRPHSHAAVTATAGLAVTVLAAGSLMAAGILRDTGLPGTTISASSDASPTAEASPTPPPRPTRLVAPGLVSQGKPLSAIVSTGTIYQGGATLVTVPGAISGSASFLGRTYPLAATADGLAGFIAAGVLDPAGESVLTITAVDALGKQETLERPLAILETQWTVDYITLPPGVGSGLTPEVVQAEEDLLAATYAGLTGRAWDGPWLVPLTAPVSGYFGEQRSFNGGPVGGHHGGTDFGAEEGTPVVTPNSGTVVLAEELAVRGNMVIIDHGAGVFSGYAHLLQINVTAGQAVATGEVIGLVGTTGLSTGPHLHWEMAVSGILVDGLRWVDGSQGF